MTEESRKKTPSYVTLFIVILILTVPIAVPIVAPFVNNSMAKKTAKELAALPLPKDTEYVEYIYRAAKLIGNGNRMQYFGAILLKSDLSLEELQNYYSNFAEHEWECIVEKQESARITAVEHETLEFKTNLDGDNYFIVYSWGDNRTIFHEFDIRGH